MKIPHTTIIAFALFALAGCGGSKSEPPSGLPATRKAPTFSSAAANDFVKNLSQTANDYVAAVKAKDVAKINTLTPKLAGILKTRQTVASTLKPDEAGKLMGWTHALLRQVQDAATAAAGPPIAL